MQVSDTVWHDLHNFRVEKTFAFFNQNDVAPLLIIMLETFQSAHQIMAWLMKHLALKQTSRHHGPESPSRVDIVPEFVRPATSPITKALCLGSNLLHDRLL